MKKLLILAAGLIACGLPQSLPAQVANEGLANAILAARKQNATLMKQFSWNCRTGLEENGTVKDTRIDTVTYGPDGQPQHTLLNDQSNPLPRGFLTKAGCRAGTRQAGKISEGFASLPASIHAAHRRGGHQFHQHDAPFPRPDRAGCCSLAAAAVAVPGDTVSLSVYVATKATRRMSIMTTFQNDDVTVTATFKTLASGLNYPAYIQINVPEKNLTVLIQNYDYINQNN